MEDLLKSEFTTHYNQAFSTVSGIVTTTNELKDRDPRDDVRQGATKQLLESLKTIISVKSICEFINKYDNKHCCIFNKKPAKFSEQINAIEVFNRLSSIMPHGYQMRNPDIESYGFELWEFSNNQTYLLEDKSRIKSIAEQLSKLSTKEIKELAEIIQSEHNIK